MLNFFALRHVARRSRIWRFVQLSCCSRSCLLSSILESNWQANAIPDPPYPESSLREWKRSPWSHLWNRHQYIHGTQQARQIDCLAGYCLCISLPTWLGWNLHEHSKRESRRCVVLIRNVCHRHLDFIKYLQSILVQNCIRWGIVLKQFFFVHVNLITTHLSNFTCSTWPIDLHRKIWAFRLLFLLSPPPASGAPLPHSSFHLENLGRERQTEFHFRMCFLPT